MTRTKGTLLLWALSASLGLGLLGAGPARGDTKTTASGGATAADAPGRFTAETPDALVETQKRRALAPKATEADVIASLALIATESDRATNGLAERALAEIAAAPSVGAETRGEAAALARTLASDEGTAAGAEKARGVGILTDVSVLGPFRDTGGGLEAHDGPEQSKSAAFGDPKTFYSWGTVEVAWRSVPPTFSQARGVPLDMFVHPRKESCSFVSSKIKLATSAPIVVRVAAAGQVRLVFDGVDIGKSDDVHGSARLDRLAAQGRSHRGRRTSSRRRSAREPSRTPVAFASA